MNDMVFTTCRSCEKEDQYVICANCEEHGDFTLENSVAECSCGHRSTFMYCDCGAIIYGKFYFIDKDKEADQSKKIKEDTTNKKHNLIMLAALSLLFLLGFSPFC